MSRTHGKVSSYLHGCRCEICTAANRAYTRHYRLRRQGWNEDTYETALRQQGGRCAICHQEDPRFPQLMTDHDHETGEARGLLCSRCNLVLGNLEDSIPLIVSLFEYLVQYGKELP